MSQELVTVAAIAAGCAAGGVARYWMSGWVDAATGSTFPWGTLAVNAIGSLLIGLIAAVSGPQSRVAVSPLLRITLTAGVMGGFTTFSAFSLQSLLLAQQRDWVSVCANVGLSVTLCLLAVWAGWQLGTEIAR